MLYKLDIQFFGGRGASSSGGSGSGGGKLGHPREQRDDYTPEQYKALENYTGSSSINKHLGVEGYDNMDAYYKKMADNLDSAIAKSGWNKTETDTPYMRGAGAIVVGVPQDMKFSSKQELADYINKNSVGNKYTNEGYTSITTTPSVARSFANSQSGKNPIILEYKQIKKGTKGAYVSGGHGKKPISVFGSDEDETLMQRKVKTTPISAWVGNDGYVHVAVIAGG